MLLGGTAEARELAGLLSADVGLRVVTSLAGRLSDARDAAAGNAEAVRRGGFGGADGMVDWLRASAPALVVDATHPFAAQISAHALAAAARLGIPLLRLQRPPWRAEAGDRWLRVPDVATAADLVADTGRRPLITIGRQQVAAFFAHSICSSLDLAVRCVEPPDATPPPRTTVLLARGPFTLAGELALLRQHRIDVLVTKDSGGDDTRAKLHAARELGLPVVVIDRPPPLAWPAVAGSVTEALRWVREHSAADR